MNTYINVTLKNGENFPLEFEVPYKIKFENCYTTAEVMLVEDTKRNGRLFEALRTIYPDWELGQRYYCNSTIESIEKISINYCKNIIEMLKK